MKLEESMEPVETEWDDQGPLLQLEKDPPLLKKISVNSRKVHVKWKEVTEGKEQGPLLNPRFQKIYTDTSKLYANSEDMMAVGEDLYDIQDLFKQKPPKKTESSKRKRRWRCYCFCHDDV